MVGVTTELPLEYVYVSAPLGTMVNDCPAQTDPEFTKIVGKEFTVTVLIAVFVQPVSAVVPVTVYEVVEEGVTTELPLE